MPRAMQQLSPQDAAFIEADTSHANANVSLLHIYDQSTAPGGTVRFKTLMEHIESRLERSPIFRRRLMRVPFGVDRPYWVDDAYFDIEYHVRHIALPKPGDWRQFCIQASRIHARALDFERPLWEIYVIEGLDAFTDLPAGSFALLTKTHLAALGGLPAGQGGDANALFTELLHDLTAQPVVPAPPAPWFARPAPRAASLLRKGLTHAVRDVAPTALAWASDKLRHSAPVVPTRFGSVVSPHRVFDTRRFALDEFKAIRTLVEGATVNDAVLAVCGGALRRYLDALDELPTHSLNAMAPLSVNATAAVKARLDWQLIELATHLSDPVQRLRAICEQTASSALFEGAVRATELTDAARYASSQTLALASRLLGGAALIQGRRAPLANCSITNVPGPAQPQFLCGARLSYFSALMPISDGLGLAITVTSVAGRIIISPTSCRELMPQPEVFANCLRESFQELLAAALQRTTAQARAQTQTRIQTRVTPKVKTAAPLARATNAFARATKPRARRPSASDKTSRADPAV